MIGIFFRGIIFLFVMAWYTIGIFQVIDNYFRDEFKKQINIQSNKATNLKQPTITDSHANRIYNDLHSQCKHVEYNDDDEGGGNIKEQHSNGMQNDNVGNGFDSLSCEVQSASNADMVTESKRISTGRTRSGNRRDDHYVRGSDKTCTKSFVYSTP